MRNRRLSIGCLVALALVLCACSGGSDKIGGGQPDYLDQYIELSQLRVPENATGREARGILDARVELLDEMTPPDGLVEAHDAGATAWDRGYELVEAMARGDIDPGDPDVVGEIDELDAVIRRWDDAIKDYYGVWIGSVNGAAMEPAFCADASIVARAPADLAIERWSTIVFEYPEDRDRTFIKRVVGLPGETVAVRDGQITIDGVGRDDDVYALSPANYVVEPLTIPAGSYYVLGDNRRNSFDSHAFGAGTTLSREIASTVPLGHVLGVLPPEATSCPNDREATPRADQ